MADMDDDELLDALGVEVTPLNISSRTPREERIIAGFEDILRFYEGHGRAPQHLGEGGDIFERMYAVRLDQIRKLPEAQTLLVDLDKPKLLGVPVSLIDVNSLDEDSLLAELGVENAIHEENDIHILKNVRPFVEIKAAEDIANRKPCSDFEKFKYIFDEVAVGLKNGSWFTKPYVKNAGIDLNDLFIVGGQIAYVAEVNEGKITKDGRDNPRLRVIFDNKTEGDLLLRSLTRSLYPDGDEPVGQRLIKKDDGPLFGNTVEPEDIESGTIYVLRSLSTHPFIAEHRELIHKIGVTGGRVETRIANAKKDATYLLAEVEIVATYKLINLNRIKFEALFHKIFGSAQLDLSIQDRFGNPVKPREWFMVPLHVINEVVSRIQDGTITEYYYDANEACLKLVRK
jgi:hypothetical protein